MGEADTVEGTTADKVNRVRLIRHNPLIGQYAARSTRRHARLASEI